MRRFIARLSKSSAMAITALCVAVGVAYAVVYVPSSSNNQQVVVKGSSTVIREGTAEGILLDSNFWGGYAPNSPHDVIQFGTGADYLLFGVGNEEIRFSEGNPFDGSVNQDKITYTDMAEDDNDVLAVQGDNVIIRANDPISSPDTGNVEIRSGIGGDVVITLR